MKTYIVELTEDEIRYLMGYVGKDIGWHKSRGNKEGEERAKSMYHKLARVYRHERQKQQTRS